MFDKSNSSGQNNTAPDNSILHTIIVFDYLITLWFLLFGVMPSYEDIMKNTVCALYSDDKALGLKNHFQPTKELAEKTEVEVYAKYGMTIKKSASKIITHIPGNLIENGEFEFLGSTNLWSEEDSFYYPIPRERKLCTSLVKYLTCTRDVLDTTNQFQKIVQIEQLLHKTHLYEAVVAYRKHFMKKHPEIDIDSAIEQMDGLVDLSSLDLKNTRALFTGRENNILNAMQ